VCGLNSYCVLGRDAQPSCSCRCLAGFGFIDATNAVRSVGGAARRGALGTVFRGTLSEQAVAVIEVVGEGCGSEEPPESGPAAGTA